MLRLMGDLLKLIWRVVIGLFRSRAALEAEIVALRHQPAHAMYGLAELYCIRRKSARPALDWSSFTERVPSLSTSAALKSFSTIVKYSSFVSAPS